VITSSNDLTNIDRGDTRNRQELTKIAEEYLSTLVNADTQAMLNLLGTDSIIEDPRFPGNAGQEQISEFVTSFQNWVADMSPKTEHLRTTATEQRVLSEDNLRIQFSGEVWELPVATTVCKDVDSGANRVHVYYTN